MNNGRNLIIGFTQNDKHYDLVVDKYICDPVTWMFRLLEGVDSWKNNAIYGEPIYAIDDEHIGDLPTGRSKVERAVNEVNVFLKTKFGTGIPMTWIEQLEAVFTQIVFFRDVNGMPQIKIQ